MTIREVLVKQLKDNGMFDNQANEVIDGYAAGPFGESMRGRWDEDTTGYPEQLLGVLWLGVRAEALAWIDENCPAAWFKPMFT